MSFQDWFRSSGLTPVRMEQPVWDSDLEFAGTIDIVASHPQNGLGILDLKSSRSIYEEHHMQVAAYLTAGRNFADLAWGKLVRLPKSIEETSIETREIGDLPKRTLTETQLLDSFLACLKLWRTFCG